GRREFAEENWLLRDGHFAFGRVVAIVEPDADDLLRVVDGCVQTRHRGRYAYALGIRASLLGRGQQSRILEKATHARWEPRIGGDQVHVSVAGIDRRPRALRRVECREAHTVITPVVKSGYSMRTLVGGPAGS